MAPHSGRTSTVCAVPEALGPTSPYIGLHSSQTICFSIASVHTLRSVLFEEKVVVRVLKFKPQLKEINALTSAISTHARHFENGKTFR